MRERFRKYDRNRTEHQSHQHDDKELCRPPKGVIPQLETDLLDVLRQRFAPVNYDPVHREPAAPGHEGRQRGPGECLNGQAGGVGSHGCGEF